MAQSGKVYYECPAEILEGPLGTVARPLIATEVDEAGGVWSVVEHDSDTNPTSFIVAVNDRKATGQETKGKRPTH